MMKRLFLTTAGLLAMAAAPPAQAQGAPAGVVEGTVFDSTTMAHLPGARVAVLGTSVMGRSDADGAFRLGEVPVGTHSVTFFHPRLQELGISASGSAVTVREGETHRVELAVPSQETIVRAWCAAEVPGPGLTPVAGFVSDSLTGVFLPRATVTVSVLDGRDRIAQSYTVRTNEEGYYRVCNIPAGATVHAAATFGRSGSNLKRIRVPQEGVAFQDLQLVLSSIGEIQGTVTDYATRRPLSGARVTVAGVDAEALTDQDGSFILTDLPPGMHLVETEYLGYATRVDSVTIFSDEAVLVQVPLSTEAIQIEGMVVTARARLGEPLTDPGRRTDFIGRPQVEAILPRVQNVGDLVQGANFPGLSVREIRVVDGPMQLPGVCIEHNRVRRGSAGCAMITVFVDNLRLPEPSTFLMDLDPNIVESVQLLAPAEAALRYGAQGVNGVLIITTRRGR